MRETRLFVLPGVAGSCRFGEVVGLGINEKRLDGGVGNRGLTGVALGSTLFKI